MIGISSVLVYAYGMDYIEYKLLGALVVVLLAFLHGLCGGDVNGPE
jgi:hypothetical protein